MAPIKVPFMMRNLTTFPIERLCFDLKLELLEQLDAKDVIELVKVNQGFQWMISSRPSVVFGHHVDTIQFGFDSQRIEVINIKKLNGKSLKVSLDVIRYFPFIKNIRSCDKLWMGDGYGSLMNKDHGAFLKQLEAVDSFCLFDYSPARRYLLSHLSTKIKIFAGLPRFMWKAPSIRDLVGHFIETQLNECKIVRFDCDDDDGFLFYYNALIKTHIKYVLIDCCYDENLIVAAIQRIVRHGIPSENPAAVVKVLDNFVHGMKATIVVFLKGYPGVKQINGKSLQSLIALANDRWKGSGYRALMKKTLCFRRNINATRDCIYMLFSTKSNPATYIDFFAFYIKPDEMFDH